MSGIRVLVRPATPGGRLYPRYDEEAGVLVVESEVQRPWPLGVDVDGRIVFDLDEHRVLANVDVHVPRNRWVRDLEEDWPSITGIGDLAFAPESVATKSFHASLRVRSDRRVQRVQVELGATEPDAWIGLSEACVALLAKEELVGFLIKDIQ